MRRGFIGERYGELIEALYSGQESCRVNAAVRFEDGRVGRIEADVRIREADVYPAREKALPGAEGDRLGKERAAP